MSVDITVIFSHKIDLEDVGCALALVAGAPSEYKSLPRRAGGDNESGYIKIPSLKYSAFSAMGGENGFPDRIRMKFDSPLGELNCSFITRMSDGTQGIMLPSTPFWIALSKRLVSIFGGKILDGESDRTILEVPLENAAYPPSSPSNFKQMKFSMKDIHPLSPEEIASSVDDAAYKDVDDDTMAKFAELQAERLRRKAGDAGLSPASRRQTV